MGLKKGKSIPDTIDRKWQCDYCGTTDVATQYVIHDGTEGHACRKCLANCQMPEHIEKRRLWAISVYEKKYPYLKGKLR